MYPSGDRAELEEWKESVIRRERIKSEAHRKGVREREITSDTGDFSRDEIWTEIRTRTLDFYIVLWGCNVERWYMKYTSIYRVMNAKVILNDGEHFILFYFFILKKNRLIGLAQNFCLPYAIGVTFRLLTWHHAVTRSRLIFRKSLYYTSNSFGFLCSFEK